MFRLHIDLHVHYLPLMDEHRPGIVFTREVELPFPPWNGLLLHGSQLDDTPEPMGFKLEEVIWDLDRTVFLASTSLDCAGFPLAFIGDEVRARVAAGWRLGSYADAYAEGTDDGLDEDGPEGEQAPASGDAEDEELLPTLAPNRRPREFNRLLKALVAHMAATLDNLEIVYAIEQTNRYFTPEQEKATDDPWVQKWLAARREFAAMSWDEQYDWRGRVMGRPGLESIL